MIQKLDHIQLAFPAGSEDALREFYCASLGMTEVAKPEPLQGRGGFWATAGSLQVHFGVDPNFHPATKAHPALIVSDLNALAKTLVKSGANITWDHALPGVERFFTQDPVGNRIECMTQR